MEKAKNMSAEKTLLRRSDLIDNIKSETFCRLGASSISGVGVFAVRDIPKSTKLFETCNEIFTGLPIEVSELELRDADEGVVEYMKDMTATNGKGSYYLPAQGLNSVSICFYLNHSYEPNVEFLLEGDLDDFVIFASSREIKKGEELTQNYTKLCPNKAKLFEQFPFLHSDKK